MKALSPIFPSSVVLSIILFILYSSSADAVGCDDTGIVKTLYEDIGSTSPFVGAINQKGDVAITGSTVRLTTTSANQAGGFWFTSPISFQGDGGFSVKFALTATAGIGNGEGWNFVMQTISNNEPIINGPSGWSRANSFVIEFDTSNSGTGNQDLTDNHIGVFLNQTQRCNAPLDTGSFSNGSTWAVWVDFSGYNEQLEVRLNALDLNRPADPTLTCNVGIWGTLDIEDDVYAGFTASNPINQAGTQHELQEYIAIADAYRPYDTDDCAVYDTCTQRSTSSMCVTYLGQNECATLACPPSPFWDVGGTECCRFVEKQTNRIITPASDFIVGDNVTCEVTRSTILQLAPSDAPECAGIVP